MLEESSNTILGSPPMFENKYDSDNQNFLREHIIDMKNWIEFLITLSHFMQKAEAHSAW